MMSAWRPVFDRGDGVWLGEVDGRIAVGDLRQSSRLVPPGNFIPFWVLLEASLDEILAKISPLPRDFISIVAGSPQKLIEQVVASAVHGGRPYWVELSVQRIAEMVDRGGFDEVALADTLSEILQLPGVGQVIASKARHLQGGLCGNG